MYMYVCKKVSNVQISDRTWNSSKNSKHTKSCMIPLSNKKNKTPWRNESLQTTMEDLHVSLGAQEVIEYSK